MFIIANAMILLCSCRTNEPAIMVRKEINTGWTFRQVGEEKWFPAEVPGCVHTDLMTNGIIEDPFYRLNEHNVQWIEKADSGFNIRLVTDKLAKNVFLQIEDEEGFFSDNYFDMLPGEEVAIHLVTNISEEKLRKVLSIRTLDNAF